VSRPAPLLPSAFRTYLRFTCGRVSEDRSFIANLGLLHTNRYIQKFYQMRTQLQAVSLRIQTVRSNEQMMQSMKGATSLLGSMNRSMNLPALQRIAMEFEKENDIMDQRQEMMDDAIDDVTGLEDEEEGDEVVREVLDEIGIDLGQAVSSDPFVFGRLSGSGVIVHDFARGEESYPDGQVY